jgi:hypothetical protein
MNRKDKMVASQPIKRINGGSAADKKALSREAHLSAAQRHLSLRSSYFILSKQLNNSTVKQQNNKNQTK